MMQRDNIRSSYLDDTLFAQRRQDDPIEEPSVFLRRRGLALRLRVLDEKPSC